MFIISGPSSEAVLNVRGSAVEERKIKGLYLNGKVSSVSSPVTWLSCCNELSNQSIDDPNSIFNHLSSVWKFYQHWGSLIDGKILISLIWQIVGI